MQSSPLTEDKNPFILVPFAPDAVVSQRQRQNILRRQNNCMYPEQITDDDIFSILQKSCRTQSDCVQLEERVGDYQIFKRIHRDQPQLLRRIVKCLTFEFVPKGRAVYFQGDQSDSLYVILKGRVLSLSRPGSIYPVQYQSNSLLPQLMNLPSQKQKKMSRCSLKSMLKFQFQQPQQQQYYEPLPVTRRDTCNIVLRIMCVRHFQRLVRRVIHILRQIRKTSFKSSKCHNQSSSKFNQSSTTTSTQQASIFDDPKLYGETRFQRIRRDILQSVHSEFDLEHTENLQHFFADKMPTPINPTTGLAAAVPPPPPHGFIYSTVSRTSLTEGDSFGQIGLLNRQPRESTIYCTTDCYLAKLSKEHYLVTLKEMNMQKALSRTNLLLQALLPVIPPNTTFESIQNRFSKYQQLFRKHKYPIGHCISKQSQPIQSIQIIKNGEVTVSSGAFQLAVLPMYEIIHADEIIYPDQSSPIQFSKLSYHVKSEFCTLLCISPNDFQLVLEEFPDIREHIMASTASKRKWIDQRLKDQQSLINQISNNLKNRRSIARRSVTEISQKQDNLSDDSQERKEIPKNQESKQSSQHSFHQFDPLMVTMFSPASVITKRFLKNKNKNKSNMNSSMEIDSPSLSGAHVTKEAVISSTVSQYFAQKIASALPQNSPDMSLAKSMVSSSTSNVESQKIVEEGLALKYAYLHSVSSNKIQPRQVMDFIFNHKETPEQQAIIDAAVSSKSSFTNVVAENQRQNRYLNQQNILIKKVGKHNDNNKSMNANSTPKAKLDSTLGYPNELIQSIGGRQSSVENTSENMTRSQQMKQQNPNSLVHRKLNVDLDTNQVQQHIKENRQLLQQILAVHPELQSTSNVWYTNNNVEQYPPQKHFKSQSNLHNNASQTITKQQSENQLLLSVNPSSNSNNAVQKQSPMTKPTTERSLSQQFFVGLTPPPQSKFIRKSLKTRSSVPEATHLLPKLLFTSSQNENTAITESPTLQTQQSDCANTNNNSNIQTSTPQVRSSMIQKILRKCRQTSSIFSPISTRDQYSSLTTVPSKTDFSRRHTCTESISYTQSVSVKSLKSIRVASPPTQTSSSKFFSNEESSVFLTSASEQPQKRLSSNSSAKCIVSEYPLAGQDSNSPAIIIHPTINVHQASQRHLKRSMKFQPTVESQTGSPFMQPKSAIKSFTNNPSNNINTFKTFDFQLP